MRTNSRNGARRQRAGRALSGLAVLFLLVDSTGKLLQVQPVIDGAIRLGYPRDLVFTLDVILLACEAPLFTHVLFPTCVAAVLWSGLLLRDARRHAFLPIRSAS